MRQEKNHSEEFLHLPFKDLKKLLQTKKKKKPNDNPKTSAARERSDLSRPRKGQPEKVPINDEKLFHDAMKEVQEIRESSGIFWFAEERLLSPVNVNRHLPIRKR